jgi:protein gp37
MRMAARLQAMQHQSYLETTRLSGGRPVWTGKINLLHHTLSIPLRWKKPRKIFVNSMSDLFQDGIRPEFVTKVWDAMKQAHWHTFQVLTKRPENMLAVLRHESLPTLPNVWLGTSVESKDYVKRISVLRKVPAAVRFVSFEPLLGPVGRVNLSQINWAIVGGESGPRARVMQEEWVTQLKTQCDRQSVAFFFKQWGGTNKKAAGRRYTGRTWNCFPVVAELSS